MRTISLRGLTETAGKEGARGVTGTQGHRQVGQRTESPRRDKQGPEVGEQWRQGLSIRVPRPQPRGDGISRRSLWEVMRS